MITAPGFQYFPGYLSEKDQVQLVGTLQEILSEAPYFQPTMPRTGKPFSVQMSNCGDLGWVSDKEGGYRYQAQHPVTGRDWPALPTLLLAIWEEVAGYAHPPQACLINLYKGRAKMGLHQDKDEEDFSAPVVSLSLGDRARFRVGGQKRRDPTQSMDLHSGDVVVLGGDARLAYHGIDRVYSDTSELLSGCGRINLTMRRVSPA